MLAQLRRHGEFIFVERFVQTFDFIVIEAFDADIPDTEEVWGSDEGEGDESAEVPADFLETMASRQSVRVVLSPPQARSFVRRARALVSAGRPPCPFCGGPLDPAGHVCPRANGYKR